MKKILALVLALMLVLSMGFAFAADVTPDDGGSGQGGGNDTPTYTDASSVTVTKSYKLEGAGSSPAETFTLEQVGDGVVVDGDAKEAPHLGTITGAAYTAEDGATSAGNEKDITIALPTYTNVGIYEYTLKEVAGTNAGVTYYGSNILLRVTVIQQDDKIRVAAVHTESSDTEEKDDKFENTYSAGTLKVSKTVTGNLGDKSKYFKFTVTLTGEDGKTYPASFAVSGGSYAQNPTTAVIGTNTFYLKDGETISIANLPFGVTYTVDEDTPTDYTLTKDGDTGSIDAAEQIAAFTNEKEGKVDTGINMDSVPYIVLLGIVVLAGAAMMLKKRSTND